MMLEEDAEDTVSSPKSCSDESEEVNLVKTVQKSGSYRANRNRPAPVEIVRILPKGTQPDINYKGKYVDTDPPDITDEPSPEPDRIKIRCSTWSRLCSFLCHGSDISRSTKTSEKKEKSRMRFRRPGNEKTGGYVRTKSRDGTDDTSRNEILREMLQSPRISDSFHVSADENNAIIVTSQDTIREGQLLEVLRGAQHRGEGGKTMRTTTFRLIAKGNGDSQLQACVLSELNTSTGEFEALGEEPMVLVLRRFSDVEVRMNREVLHRFDARAESAVAQAMVPLRAAHNQGSSSDALLCLELIGEDVARLESYDSLSLAASPYSRIFLPLGQLSAWRAAATGNDDLTC